jgi:NAD(P)-dependent dehydrogenase (short-subunit alcohol dehydrogenase family)
MKNLLKEGLTMKDSRKIVLVSGASSGLGLATAQYLYKQGCIVYTGARSYKTDKMGQAVGQNQGALYKAYLDVTNPESIEKLVHEIIQREGRIDVLINCAAVLVLGSVEDISFDEFHKVLDTNLYGDFRMCRSVLPYMREQKKGLIINFSSGAALVGIPFQSAYCSSKYAIEGFSEALRWEVKNFGIDVVLVEPGDAKSGSNAYRLHAKGADSELSPYRFDFKTVTEKIASDEANGSEPEMTARVVYKIITKSKPAIRYNAFRYLEKLLLLKLLLPTKIAESIFFSYYNLSKTKGRDQNKNT